LHLGLVRPSSVSRLCQSGLSLQRFDV
jgi:hypothetical protein